MKLYSFLLVLGLVGCGGATSGAPSTTTPTAPALLLVSNESGIDLESNPPPGNPPLSRYLGAQNYQMSHEIHQYYPKINVQLTTDATAKRWGVLHLVVHNDPNGFGDAYHLGTDAFCNVLNEGPWSLGASHEVIEDSVGLEICDRTSVPPYVLKAVYHEPGFPDVSVQDFDLPNGGDYLGITGKGP